MRAIFLIPTVVAVVLGATYLLADDDRYERKYSKDQYISRDLKPIQKSTDEKLYIKECGSCHMAYQKEFLPKRSWDKMINTLDNHFGVDATLEAEDKTILLNYLKKPSNGYVDRHVYKLASSIQDNSTPLRVSDTPYFKKEHRGITKKMIDQKEVKSIANCTACHKNAQNADYSERSIFIPNYGSWDD